MSYRNVLESRARARSGATLTPQSLPIPGREADMSANAAGGMVFSVDAWERLRRFLVLGSDAGTYYAQARDLTLENVDALVDTLRLDGRRVVREIVVVSEAGRAPRNDAALLALAVAASWGVGSGDAALRGKPASRLSREEAIRLGGDADVSADVRRAAFAALPRVARTGTHLMQFVGHMVDLRGWGQAALSGVGGWFTGMDAERLALQAVKYRQRGGWTLRDVLRLTHPRADGADRAALFDWIVHRDVEADAADGGGERTNRFGVPVRRTPRRHALRARDEIVADASSRFRVVDGFHRVRAAASAKEAACVVRSHSLPWEAVPTDFLNDRDVWDALLADMGMTAMVRNMAKMTAVGLLENGSEAARFVADRLADSEQIVRARIHPVQILLALKNYASGRGFRGGLTWAPVHAVSDALDAAFYLAFDAVEPSGARHMLGVDISGSMRSEVIANSNLTAREGAAAMAMVTHAVEPACAAWGFTSSGGGWGNRSNHGLTDIALSRKERLDKLVHRMDGLPMGGTDAGLLIRKALESRAAVDAFVIYTDNETWAGQAHVSELLDRYRRESGIPARLVAVGMTATKFSVVDPADRGQMSVAGFDASAPAMIADFVRPAASAAEAKPSWTPRTRRG